MNLGIEQRAVAMEFDLGHAVAAETSASQFALASVSRKHDEPPLHLAGEALASGALAPLCFEEGSRYSLNPALLYRRDAGPAARAARPDLLLGEPRVFQVGSSRRVNWPDARPASAHQSTP